MVEEEGPSRGPEIEMGAETQEHESIIIYQPRTPESQKKQWQTIDPKVAEKILPIITYLQNRESKRFREDLKRSQVARLLTPSYILTDSEQQQLNQLVQSAMQGDIKISNREGGPEITTKILITALLQSDKEHITDQEKSMAGLLPGLRGRTRNEALKKAAAIHILRDMYNLPTFYSQYSSGRQLATYIELRNGLTGKDTAVDINSLRQVLESRRDHEAAMLAGKHPDWKRGEEHPPTGKARDRIEENLREVEELLESLDEQLIANRARNSEQKNETAQDKPFETAELAEAQPLAPEEPRQKPPPPETPEKDTPITKFLIGEQVTWVDEEGTVHTGIVLGPKEKSENQPPQPTASEISIKTNDAARFISKIDADFDQNVTIETSAQTIKAYIESLELFKAKITNITINFSDDNNCIVQGRVSAGWRGSINFTLHLANDREGKLAVVKQNIQIKGIVRIGVGAVKDNLGDVQRLLLNNINPHLRNNKVDSIRIGNGKFLLNVSPLRQ